MFQVASSISERHMPMSALCQWCAINGYASTFVGNISPYQHERVSLGRLIPAIGWFWNELHFGKLSPYGPYVDEIPIFPGCVNVHLHFLTESKPFPASFVQTQSSNEAQFKCAVFKTPVGFLFQVILYYPIATVEPAKWCCLDNTSTKWPYRAVCGPCHGQKTAYKIECVTYTSCILHIHSYT